MVGATVGLLGKLPSHGDFLSRRVSPDFSEIWDEWLQRGLAESQRQLGAQWLDAYLTSPMWRFVLAGGLAGESSYCGLMIPSVDRVGRYFPLTITVELPAMASPLVIANAADSWFRHIEHLCADALQAEQFNFEELDSALIESSHLLTGLDQTSSTDFGHGTATHWRWPISSASELTTGLIEPFGHLLEQTLRPLSLWWTDGSERIRPSVLLVQSLPHCSTFASLLVGNWNDGQWQGMTHDEVAESVAAVDFQYAAEGAASSEVGPVRERNEDRVLVHPVNRVWAVADGMGGHERGDVASQMVVDALNSLEPTATLNSTLEAVRVALDRVNADLQRAALQGAASGTCGSTVVALFTRGPHFCVVWAGDSRAYLWRDTTLSVLTTDHSVQNDGTLTSLVSGSSELTRAVGGEAALQLDQIVNALALGDRFLLCSDGLYSVLSNETIAEEIAQGTPEQTARQLVERAISAGTRDNVTAVVVDIKPEA
jgi:type VI secretion system protein ImpM